MSLPGPVPPVLAAALDLHPEPDRFLVESALTAKDSGRYRVTAEDLSQAMAASNTPVSMTTIKFYRRTIIDRLEKA